MAKIEVVSTLQTMGAGLGERTEMPMVWKELSKAKA